MSGGTLGAVRQRGDTPTRAVHMPRWRMAGWSAVAVTLLFIALSWWWLATDHAVPFGGAATHLYVSQLYQEWIAEGHPFRAIVYDTYYPPAIRLFGAVVVALFGRGPDGPVLAQNIVFVPLLALACYRVGRMVAGSRAGLLAVVFALGAPLIAEQFHVFMLDAPQAALVAVAVWLLLESERFKRRGPAALAGLAVGLGLLTKQLMPLYLVGLIAALLLRDGGWRNWRGIVVFAVVALAIALPWYLVHLDEWGRFASAAGSGTAIEAVPLAARPSLVSLANLSWYVWATLNGLLFAPLFAFAAIGTLSALVRVVRARPTASDDPTVELLCGLGGAWLALTLMRHHDVRYTMGAIVFLAVLATAWIVRSSPRTQALATGLLVTAVIVAQLGATFGVGRDPAQLPLSNGAIGQGEGVPPRDRVVVYSSLDYLVSGPLRDGDVLGLMRRLKAAGVARVAIEDHGDVNDHLFELVGLLVFARAAGVGFDSIDPPQDGAPLAQLIRTSSFDGSRPCTRLFNGTGVWVRIGDRVACPR